MTIFFRTRDNDLLVSIHGVNGNIPMPRKTERVMFHDTVYLVREVTTMIENEGSYDARIWIDLERL